MKYLQPVFSNILFWISFSVVLALLVYSIFHSQNNDSCGEYSLSLDDFETIADSLRDQGFIQRNKSDTINLKSPNNKLKIDNLQFGALKLTNLEVKANSDSDQALFIDYRKAPLYFPDKEKLGHIVSYKNGTGQYFMKNMNDSSSN